MRLTTTIPLVLSIACLLGGPGALASPSAFDIVKRADATMWGEKTQQGEFEMAVVTPSWTRTLAMKAWIRRSEKSFIRIVAPAKDAGIGSLSVGDDMWNYLPSIERTVKIPPSMMLQPWLGSDFTNDDLMKEGSLLKDYTHKLIGEKTVDGAVVFELELLPKPDAAVAWGRIIYSVRKDDFIPVRQVFYDERGRLIRQLVYSDIRSMDGRKLPTHWEMRPENKPGKSTVIKVKSVKFDQAIDDGVFSLRNLTRRD